MTEEEDIPRRNIDGLKRRNLSFHAPTDEAARETVIALNEEEENSSKKEQDKKTFGRTPDGTVFTVPYTHDMVTQLLSPFEPKNASDILVLAVLVLHITLAWVLPAHLRTPLLACLFLFWRAGYNVGIGILLHLQSHEKFLTRWAYKSRIFVNPSTGKNPHPRLWAFMKRELETKIPIDYRLEDAPLEYNTWLVFRRVVDLILMCDFVSYILFAFACGHRPVNESPLITGTRWAIGISLFLINLWVKLDAHRVVKDFAWYWGDFFYLIDQELTFDGVFEMAPHPMYSIGYVGYYGISLMAASYKVLLLSIVAHAAQFAFLVWVESPHIERTYNSPPPRKRLSDTDLALSRKTSNERGEGEYWAKVNPEQPSSAHNLLGLGNFDFYRITDSSVFVLMLSFAAMTFSTPSTPFYRALFVTNAALWRLWYSFGIGFILNRQSEKKKWTRHFLKYGDSTSEAWRQWKGSYHLSMVLCYSSLAAAAYKMYVAPTDWTQNMVAFKHIIGLGLIALQMWVSVSIYEQLGEFGWFFGDFFFDHSPKLTYGGIYRFLNNPERVLGLAGVWGVALICNSRAIFGVALLSHLASLAFIQFVERPHMQKLYGRHLRQDAGLVRSLRRSLPPPFRQWQDGMDRVLGETFDVVEDFLDAARPRLAAGVSTLVQDTRELLQGYPARLMIARVDPDLAGFHPKDYRLDIEGTPASNLNSDSQSNDKRSNAKNSLSEDQDRYRPLIFEYGAPIKVKWTAPANHSKLDWVGLYKITDNASREITKISASRRWIATNPREFEVEQSEVGQVSYDVKPNSSTVIDKDEPGLVTGEMIFFGDKLWWTLGSFEFRYHHDRKHNVMAISTPFEIQIPRFSDDDLIDVTPFSRRSDQHHHPHQPQNEALLRTQIEKALLPVVQNCFDRNSSIAPRTADETFGDLMGHDPKYAKRVVYAVHQMFGIEFAQEVVRADGKVSNLAWRIWEAKKVLAPYSMSTSKGTSTPVEESLQPLAAT